MKIIGITNSTHEALEGSARGSGRTVDDLAEAVITRHLDEGGALERLDLADDVSEALAQYCADLGVSYDTAVCVAVWRKANEYFADRPDIALQLNCTIEARALDALMNMARERGITVGALIAMLLDACTVSGN